MVRRARCKVGVDERTVYGWEANACVCVGGGWREGLGMENAFRRGEGSFGDGMRGWQTMLCANQKLGSKTSRDARKSRIGWRRRWRFLGECFEAYEVRKDVAAAE